MNIVGFVIAAIGLLLLASLPKTDRRFKTGYKDNQVPNPKVVLFGLAALALGGGLVWLNSRLSNDEKKAAAPAAEPQHDPVTALQRCIVEANTCSETAPMFRCFERQDVQAEATQTCDLWIEGTKVTVGNLDVCRGMRYPIACCDSYNRALMTNCDAFARREESRLQSEGKKKRRKHRAMGE